MPYRGQIYDSATLALVANAGVAAWREFEAGHHSIAEAEVRRMVLRIMDAVADGERDPERLKEIALRLMDA
jgi:hypothetical protein